MPTRNPRVNVCVTPAQHDLLKKLARMQGRSAASLVRDMVDAAEPMMAKTADMLDLLYETKGATREAALEAMREVLEEIQALMGPSAQPSLFEALMDEKNGSVADAPAPSGAREEGAATPPSSNTGVRVSGRGGA